MNGQMALQNGTFHTTNGLQNPHYFRITLEMPPSKISQMHQRLYDPKNVK